MNTQLITDYYRIVYEGNSELSTEWLKHNHKRRYDIKLFNNKKIECKYLSKLIFTSWFDRDWKTREANIYVTTNKEFIPEVCREWIKKNHRVLMTFKEYVNYLYHISGEYDKDHFILKDTNKRVLNRVLDIVYVLLDISNKCCNSNSDRLKITSKSKKRSTTLCDGGELLSKYRLPVNIKKVNNILNLVKCKHPLCRKQFIQKREGQEYCNNNCYKRHRRIIGCNNCKEINKCKDYTAYRNMYFLLQKKIKERRTIQTTLDMEDKDENKQAQLVVLNWKLWHNADKCARCLHERIYDIKYKGETYFNFSRLASEIDGHIIRHYRVLYSEYPLETIQDYFNKVKGVDK